MNTPIKYDLRSVRRYKRLSIIMAIIFISLLVMSFLSVVMRVHYSNNIGIVSLILWELLYISVPVLLISLSLYISSSFYLRRLSSCGYIPPESKADYADLSQLPRTSADTPTYNNYARDSIISAVVFLIGLAVCIVLDISLIIKWSRYNMLDAASIVFILAAILHLALFGTMSAVSLAQRNTEKYIDNVDIRDGRRIRISLITSIAIFIVFGLISAFSIKVVDTMTDYVYKSRNGSYDKTDSDLMAGATMNVTSEDLIDGKWDRRISRDEGENLSPELSYDSVEGAKYYYIYMVDESANYWSHLVATDITENHLASGANISTHTPDDSFSYVGPYPPEGSGPHTYTIYVFAMADKPITGITPAIDHPSISPVTLYYDSLNIRGIEDDGNIRTYGNVLAYGYISGTYER